MKKFEMLKDDKIEIGGNTLYRIRALKNFGNVKVGDIGGYIEMSENLSQEGRCWVYDSACVFGNARVFNSTYVFDNALVFGNAQVYGDAQVYGNVRFSCNGQINKSNDYLCIMNIGGGNDTITFFKTRDNKIGVACEYFTGTIDEFLQAVNKTHGENKQTKAYKLACELARVQLN